MIIGRTTTHYGAMVGWELEHVMMETGKQKQYFEQYIQFVDERNTAVKKDIRATMDNYIKCSTEEEHYDIYDSFRYDLEKHEKFYPDLLFDSVFISIYRYLEHRLREICRILYGDLEGRVVPNYKKNIIGTYYKIVNFFCDRPLSTELWNEINRFRQMRNDIVHHNVDDSITKEVVIDFNNTVEKFIYDIGKKIDTPEECPDTSLIPRR